MDQARRAGTRLARQAVLQQKGLRMKNCDWRSLGLTVAVLLGAIALITALSL